MRPSFWGALIGGTLTEVGLTGERASLPHPLNISGHNSLFLRRIWGPLKVYGTYTSTGCTDERLCQNQWRG